MQALISKTNEVLTGILVHVRMLEFPHPGSWRRPDAALLTM
ncbi:hypothetical protein SAMN05421750_11336 [Agrobacterium pusense]|nr:hypothetical protein SAMN05421750_11336 [Agrobacterium pusense]